MKTRVLILMILFFSGFTEPVFTQEKYAILISGDRPDYDAFIYSDLEWASWNDTYLMWEMLVYEKGFDNDNVFVLWADGIDWSLNLLYPGADRYDAQQMHPDDFPYQDDQITDDLATLANVQNLFQDLADVGGDLPPITEDDFLFVWLYGRNDNPG